MSSVQKNIQTYFKNLFRHSPQDFYSVCHCFVNTNEGVIQKRVIGKMALFDPPPPASPMSYFVIFFSQTPFPQCHSLKSDKL